MIRSTLAAFALLLPLLAAAQRAPHDVPQGLVASYPLDGDAVDQVSRVRATPVATRPVEDRHGVRGAALWFDGARSAVNLGSALQPARFTLTAWIRPDAVDRVAVIVSKIRNLPGHWQKNLELRVEPGGRLLLHVPSGTAWDAVVGTRPIPVGRWTHVAATYDGARAQLYVDGTPDGAPLAVRYEQSVTDTWLGARPESGGRDGRTPAGPTFFFLGALDEVSVWNRALAPAELALVAGRAPPPPEPPRAPYPPLPGPPPDEQAAPLAVYPLDGDAREAEGGAAGVVIGARPAEDRNGNPRGALAFSGKDHVDLGVRSEPERLSLAVWLRPTRAERDQVIFSKVSTAPGARERWLELKLDNAGRLVLVLPSTSAVAASVTSTKRLASGRWVHVAATYDGDEAVLYVDGAPAGAARLEPFEASRGPTFVGARPDARGKRARFAQLFDGRMDDLRVYSGALSPGEVAIVAREGERPPGRGDGDDEDGADAPLVLVGRLLVRYDAAIVRRDPARVARVEERIARELEEAAREARGDRELAERLRQAVRELERGRGQGDATSLDRKRSALVSLADDLWNDLARELDEPAPPAHGPRRGEW